MFVLQVRTLQLQKQLSSQYSAKSLKIGNHHKNLIDVYKAYIVKSKKQSESQTSLLDAVRRHDVSKATKVSAQIVQGSLGAAGLSFFHYCLIYFF